MKRKISFVAKIGHIILKCKASNENQGRSNTGLATDGPSCDHAAVPSAACVVPDNMLNSRQRGRLDNREILGYVPRRHMTIPRLTYLVILLGTVVWCLALFLAPLCANAPRPLPEVAAVLYGFFRPICHQIAERSVMLVGKQMAVCSRCSGIYLGFLAGTLLYPLFRKIQRPSLPTRLLLAVAVCPMLLDIFSGVIGIHTVSVATRLVTGGIFGLFIPFVVIPVAIEGAVELFSQHAPSALINQKGLSDA